MVLLSAFSPSAASLHARLKLPATGTLLVTLTLLLALSGCGSAGGNTETGGSPPPDPPEDTNSPSAPSSLEADAGDNVITLTWDAVSADDLDGYRVYRAPEPEASVDAMTDITSSLAASATFEDETVANGTTYYYRVTAVDDAGNESAGSNQADGTPLAGPPNRP